MWRQEFLAEFITPEGAFFGASSLLAFEDSQEPFDLMDLELQDMEALLDQAMPEAAVTLEDLAAAIDAADRVNQLLYC